MTEQCQDCKVDFEVKKEDVIILKAIDSLICDKCNEERKKK